MKKLMRRAWLLSIALPTLVVGVAVDDALAGDLLGASNEEIIEEFKRTFNHCLTWRLRGREMNTIFPRTELFTQEEKIRAVKTGFRLIGEQAVPPTSLTYMLNDMALSMYLAGHPPGEIELAMFNFCSKYEDHYTKQGDGGSDPNPKLLDGPVE